MDHLVFHYEARVDEGGPANADHSSLERLPADLQAAKDREDYLVIDLSDHKARIVHI